MTEVRSQNGFAVLGALLANSVGNQAVWTRAHGENWEAALSASPRTRSLASLSRSPALAPMPNFART